MYIPEFLYIIVGLLFIGVGIYIKLNKSLEVIGDYDKKKIYNDGKLIKIIVFIFIFAGIIIVSSSVAAILFSYINSSIVFAITICTLALAVGIACSKYEIQ